MAESSTENRNRVVEKAVSLEYRSATELPRVTAVGVGRLAGEILRLAEANSIPIHQDSTLADLLTQLPAGATISQETFKLVAELLAFLYHTDREWAAMHNFIESFGLAAPTLKQSD